MMEDECSYCFTRRSPHPQTACLENLLNKRENLLFVLAVTERKIGDLRRIVAEGKEK